MRSTLLAVMLGALTANAAVDVCYFGGPNLPNFKLNGHARLDGVDLIVTDPVGNQGSSLAYNAPLSTSGNISIQMKVKISANGNGGADGITFVMHNDPAGPAALGALGDGIGYAGITKSVIVEFDTYTNSYYGDPNDNHVAVQKNGDPNHSGANRIALISNPGVTLKSGNPVWLWVEYTGATRNLRVFLANSATRPTSPIVNETVDLPAIVGPQMYLSFTGSTGGSWSKHEVMELLASDNGPAGASCCNSASQCAASPLGPICDAVKRVCGPCTLGDTTECSATKQACQVSSGINQCVMPCTGNLGAGGANPCTNSAFPVCSASGASTGSCVACNADFGRAGQACPSGAPACLANGYCGRCTSNFDCATSASHAGNYCNVSTGQCTTCSSNAQCGGSMTCTGGQCVCSADADCGANAFCAAGSCQPKRPAGQALPALRTCPASAAAVCTTARCNDSANTCAAGGGAPCTQATQCSANLCGGDSRCGCVIDGDCESNEHCAFGSRTCVADLAPGATIPSDGLHTGTCADGVAVCASGLCNGAANTCAQGNTASCASNAECSSNNCKSGRCVPSGSNGCWADADCGAASHCNRAALTCAADLPVGAAIPNDGLHGGTCTDGAAVCATGLCNSASNTCAQANAAACSANNECTNNTCKSGHCVPSGSNGCWADADCGATSYCERSALTCRADLAVGAAIPNDELHTGTCSDAAAVCASGLCNDTTKTCAASDTSSCSSNSQCQNNTCKSGHCVPSGADGCWADADCGAASHCDRAAMTCVADLPAGSALPNDGLHDGTCSSAAAVCASGLCNSTTKTCAASDTSSCSSNSQCQNNTCKSGHCVPAAANSCWADADCSGANYCDRWTYTCTAKLSSGAGVPMDGLHNGTCSDASSVCASGLCNSTTNTCAAADTASCTSSAQCQNNTCKSGHCVPAGADGCWADADCAGSGYCNRAAMQCVADLSPGAAVPNDGLHDGTCASAPSVCSTGLCNAATNTCAAPDTNACAGANQCQSNACKSGHCVPAGANGCWADADCGASNHCDRAALSCAADLAAGAAIPNDGLHDGTCANAGQVCASGLCNAATNTCASNNTESCTSAAQCESNACKSGHCVPAGANGCWADADCGASSHCDRASLSCVADLQPGALIPNDGLHDGTCAGAASVCASGLCNAATNTCASPNTESCSAASQCESNTCKSGHCVPTGADGCWANADCDASSHCDRTALRCAADLVAGAPIPNDGLHDGTCASAATSCASGLCNAATNTCAATQSAACTDASQCTTNSCVSGHCVSAAAGCWLDSDCMAMSYCDRSTWSCVADLPAGSPIPNDGLHDGACGTFNASAICLSGGCNAATNTCATDASSSCASAAECTTNTCTSGHCVPSTGGCWLDGDCGAGSFCNRTTMTCAAHLAPGVQIPSDGLHGGSCVEAASVCASGLCNDTTATCAASGANACATNADCVSNTCISNHCVAQNNGCWLDGDCAEGLFCNRANLACEMRLAAGAPMVGDGLHDGSCTSANAAAMCASGACNPTMNTCATSMETACASNSQCVTNHCASGHCVPAGANQGCWLDGDCAEGNHCDRASLQCAANLAPGAPLPSDGLHTGTCTTGEAHGVCASGACNPATNTCAATNGATCTAASQCSTNQCTSGRCVPNTGGCFVDNDCGADAWCDRHSLTCTARLPAGAQLPNDGFHDGACDATIAAAVCATGACNPTMNTCAAAVGASCVRATECDTNTCASNRCVPKLKGCGQNTDCAGNTWCDGQTFTCREQLQPGAELPSQSVCSDDTARALCSSGVCNAETNACALPERAACTSDAQCGGNACVAGRCGGGLVFGGGLSCAAAPGAGSSMGLWLLGALLALRARRQRR